MDKIPYRILEYHKMVWYKAWKDTIEYYFFDLRNLVGNIVVAIISGLVYALWSSIMQGIMIDWLGIFISVLAGFFGWGMLMLFSNGVWKIPAMLYRDRETEAYKFTWNDIEVKPFLFPKSSFGNAVGLEIISDKNRNIFNNTSQEFSIQVTKLTIFEFSEAMNKSEPKKDLYLLATDLVRFLPTTTIQNRRDANIKDNWVKHVVVLISEWDENHAWIKAKDDVKDLLLEKGKIYGVIIGFESTLVNMPMQQCAIWCNLSYIENSQGKMIVDIKVSRRNPEYVYKK